MHPTTITVDLAKSVFQVAVADGQWRVTARSRFTRAQLVRFFGERQPCRVVMEACGTAHHWGRWLRARGFTVSLLPPQYVRAYVRRNKTDRADADALLEAARALDMPTVPVKSEPQQALCALHRLRSGWMATRTARINTVRGILREFGIGIPRGAHLVLRHTHEVLENAESPLPMALRPVLWEACQEIRQLEERVTQAERQLAALAQEIPVVERLQTIPGIGLLTSTALVAAIGDIQRFPSGRHLASWLGLTPKERSSGSLRRLGRISKQGSSYLIERLRGHNKAAVAVANKLARIAWAVWRRGGEFASRPLEQAA